VSDRGMCMPFKPCALKLIDFLPSIFKKTRKEREREREKERGATFNPTHGKRKRKRHNELYITTKDVHSRKNFLSTNLINTMMCMLIDIMSIITHHSFCHMASSHCVVLNTYNNKNWEEIFSLPTKST